MKSCSPEESVISSCRYRLTGWLCLGVLVIGILLRLLYLDADPGPSEWVGFVTDEGRWVRHARSLALYGNLSDGQSLHFFIAPLFQLSNYFVFELVGVKIFTSRILTALCGGAVLVLFWRSMRQVVTPQALLLGLTLLAFQADLILLSRVAIPEMALMLFEIVIYFIIVSSDRSSWRFVAAGMLTALAVVTKLTMLLFLPIFVVIICAMPRNIGTAKEKWHDLMLFGMGLTMPLLAVAMIWYFIPETTLSFGNITKYLSTAITFLGLSRPYALISFPFDHSLSLTVNIWALGLWLSILGWTAADRKVDFLSHRYLVTSAIWFILYFLLMLTLEYFPSRYKIHVLLPMVIFITVGVSLLQRLGIEKCIESCAGVKSLSKLLWIGFVSFPTAALCSPLFISAVDFTGLQPDRLISKLVCLSLSLVLFMSILCLLRYNGRAVRFFLTFPLIGGIGWVLAASLSSQSFWPTIDSPIHIVPWLLILLATAIVSVVLVSTAGWWGSTNGAALVAACAVLYLAISLFRTVPGYLNPNYSIRDTSRNLGIVLSGHHRIGSIEADGLFNENNLPYESLTVPEFNLRNKRPENVVVAFAYERVKNVLEHEYHLIKTYNLQLGPAGDGKDRIPEEILVAVYKKTKASQKNEGQIGKLP